MKGLVLSGAVVAACLLFATDPLPAGGWATIVGMILTSFGAAVTAYFSMVSNRDRLRHDTEVANLKLSVANLQTAATECEQEHAECRREVAALSERADQAELREARMEGRLKAANRELVDLRSEVTDLRNRLYGKREPEG